MNELSAEDLKASLGKKLPIREGTSKKATQRPQKIYAGLINHNQKKKKQNLQLWRILAKLERWWDRPTTSPNKPRKKGRSIEWTKPSLSASTNPPVGRSRGGEFHGSTWREKGRQKRPKHGPDVTITRRITERGDLRRFPPAQSHGAGPGGTYGRALSQPDRTSRTSD